MPPKKGGRSGKTAPTKPPLDSCSIALSGRFPGLSQSALEADFITALGASLAKSINESTTHLVTTDVDFAKPSVKVKQAQAQSHDILIVNLTWLEDCLEQGTRLSEGSYTFAVTNATPSAVASVNGKANGSRKRTAVAIDESDEDEAQSQPKKKNKSSTANAATTTNGSQQQSQGAPNAASTPIKPEPKPIQSKLKKDVESGKANIAKPSDVIKIPRDEACPLTQYQVYIDDSGVIYDASLNQTNASNNNNKFYRLQVCHTTESS